MRGVEQWRRVSVKRVNWHFLCSVCPLQFNGCDTTWIYIGIRSILKRYKLLFQKKITLRLVFSKLGVFVFSLIFVMIISFCCDLIRYISKIFFIYNLILYTHLSNRNTDPIHLFTVFFTHRNSFKKLSDQDE